MMVVLEKLRCVLSICLICANFFLWFSNLLCSYFSLGLEFKIFELARCLVAHRTLIFHNDRLSQQIDVLFYIWLNYLRLLRLDNFGIRGLARTFCSWNCDLVGQERGVRLFVDTEGANRLSDCLAAALRSITSWHSCLLDVLFVSRRWIERFWGGRAYCWRWPLTDTAWPCHVNLLLALSALKIGSSHWCGVLSHRLQSFPLARSSIARVVIGQDVDCHFGAKFIFLDSFSLIVVLNSPGIFDKLVILNPFLLHMDGPTVVRMQAWLRWNHRPGGSFPLVAPASFRKDADALPVRFLCFEQRRSNAILFEINLALISHRFYNITRNSY